jgi:organic hydroperoxide reductase OsmC/OhrA
MSTLTVTLRNIAGTEAALGWAGTHTLVVDRPDGKAGGKGLGFNGWQLLALAIGGCFCNDLRYAAHGMNVPLGTVEVEVDLVLEGEPLTVTSATVHVTCETLDGSPSQSVITRARDISTVSNSVERGFPVVISAGTDT